MAKKAATTSNIKKEEPPEGKTASLKGVRERASNYKKGK